MSNGTLQVRAQGPSDAEALWVLEPGFEVAARWLRQSRWSAEATVAGVHSQFVGWGGWARTAHERDQRLYCWFGPGVPLKTMSFQRLPGDPERLVRLK